jgi:hypothetical protein
MSEGAHRELAKEVDARNAARVDAAKEALRQKGYVLVDDDAVRHVIIDDALRERCHFVTGRAPEGSTPQTIRLRVTEGPRPSGSTTEVVAPLYDACEFFRAQKTALDVTRSNGTWGRLVHVPVPRLVARGPNGEIVKVEAQPRVISKRKVRVDRSCDRMPMVPLDPLERAAHLMVVWGASNELRTVAMPFEREELEVECAKSLH